MHRGLIFSTRLMVHGIYSTLERTTGNELLTPDYSEKKHIRNLYSEPCVSLLSFYGTSLLTIASLKSMPNGPSWVLDWSYHFPELDFNFPSSTRGIDGKDIEIRDRSVVWDPLTSHVLLVRGTHLGKVTYNQICQLAPTNYLDHDRSTYLENTHSLTVFMDHFDGSLDPARLFKWLFVCGCPPALTELNLWPERMAQWMDLVYKPRHDSPGTFLQALRNTHAKYYQGAVDNGFVRRPVINIHLVVVHYLATTNQKLFWCKLRTARRGLDVSTGSIMCRSVFGICKSSTQCGMM